MVLFKANGLPKHADKPPLNWSRPEDTENSAFSILRTSAKPVKVACGCSYLKLISLLSQSLPLNSSNNPWVVPLNDVSADTDPLFAISSFSSTKPDEWGYFTLTFELNDAGFFEFSYVVFVVNVLS